MSVAGVQCASLGDVVVGPGTLQATRRKPYPRWKDREAEDAAAYIYDRAVVPV